MKLHVSELPGLDACEAFSPLSGLPYALLLDSADRAHADAKYSFIAAYPVETIEAKNGLVTVTNTNQQTSFEADPFAVVKERLAAWGFAQNNHADLPPFQGGAAGLFGYDLGRAIEEMPVKAKSDRDMPDMAVGIYDQVIAFDHEQNKGWIITHAADENTAQKKQEFLLSMVRRTVQNNSAAESEIEWQSNFTEENYKRQIQKVVDYITAGDIFQANLAQRFDAQLPAAFDSYAHYRD